LFSREDAISFRTIDNRSIDISLLAFLFDRQFFSIVKDILLAKISSLIVCFLTKTIFLNRFFSYYASVYFFDNRNSCCLQLFFFFVIENNNISRRLRANVTIIVLFLLGKNSISCLIEYFLTIKSIFRSKELSLF